MQGLEHELPIENQTTTVDIEKITEMIDYLEKYPNACEDEDILEAAKHVRDMCVESFFNHSDSLFQIQEEIIAKVNRRILVVQGDGSEKEMSAEEACEYHKEHAKKFYDNSDKLTRYILGDDIDKTSV